MDNRPIGFFDSGLGGLTCIPFLQKELPNEKIVYYGDTARTPYGSKTIETIEKFSFQISDYLLSYDVKMIVIACNTISATCLDLLRRRHKDIPVIGIIDPIASRIAEKEGNDVEIGVIGTKVTITSGAYANLITSKNKEVQLFSKACPALVPLIEEGIIENEIMDLTIRYYLDDFLVDNGIKKLVLGCTHYPMIAGNLHKLYPYLELFNPAVEVIHRVKEILGSRNLLSEKREGNHQCFASDLSENFLNMINRAFEGTKNVNIEFKRFYE